MAYALTRGIKETIYSELFLYAELNRLIYRSGLSAPSLLNGILAKFGVMPLLRRQIRFLGSGYLMNAGAHRLYDDHLYRGLQDVSPDLIEAAKD